jgi:hypothetical protein
MNAAAPAAAVSVPTPDEVLPAGGVPCSSPPIDKDNEDESLDFDELEFGIVTDLADKYGLVCANPEEVQEMIKYEMDHGNEIQIVPPNPELADEINRIGRRPLRTKKINRYSNDADAMCSISTTNGSFLSTWPRPTNDTMVSNASVVKAVEDMRLSQSLRAAIQSDVGSKRLCLTGCIKGLFILAILHQNQSHLSLLISFREPYAQRILMRSPEALIMLLSLKCLV